MTEERLPLAELLSTSGEADVLRTLAEVVPQLPMAAEAEGPVVIAPALRHVVAPGIDIPFHVASATLWPFRFRSGHIP